jgi:hypothetical protein
MTPPTPGVFNVRLRIGVGVALAALGVILITGFTLLPEYRLVFAFAGAIITASASCYTAYFAGTTMFETLRHQRQRLSVDELDRLHSLDITRLRNLLDTADLKSMSQADAYRRIMGDENLYVITRAFLNRLDIISTSIQVGAADELILRTALGNLSRYYYNHLLGFILEYRERSLPGSWGQFEKMVRAWNEQKSVVTGDPLNPL